MSSGQTYRQLIHSFDQAFYLIFLFQPLDNSLFDFSGKAGLEYSGQIPEIFMTSRSKTG